MSAHDIPQTGGGLKLTALTPADVARLLSKAGGAQAAHVTEAAIRADLAAGAPTNPDGTVSLIHYAAWLVKAEGETGAS